MISSDILICLPCFFFFGSGFPLLTAVYLNSIYPMSFQFARSDLISLSGAELLPVCLPEWWYNMMLNSSGWPWRVGASTPAKKSLQAKDFTMRALPQSHRVAFYITSRFKDTNSYNRCSWYSVSWRFLYSIYYNSELTLTHSWACNKAEPTYTFACASSVQCA